MTSILLELEQGELVACLACRKLLLRPASMLGEDCILVFSEAINRGFVGLVQWDMYDVRYDRAMHYGVIGDVKSGWRIKPA